MKIFNNQIKIKENIFFFFFNSNCVNIHFYTYYFNITRKKLFITNQNLLVNYLKIKKNKNIY